MIEARKIVKDRSERLCCAVIYIPMLLLLCFKAFFSKNLELEGVFIGIYLFTFFYLVYIIYTVAVVLKDKVMRDRLDSKIVRLFIENMDKNGKIVVKWAEIDKLFEGKKWEIVQHYDRGGIAIPMFSRYPIEYEFLGVSPVRIYSRIFSIDSVHGYEVYEYRDYEAQSLVFIPTKSLLERLEKQS